jgi:hypothetical protein
MKKIFLLFFIIILITTCGKDKTVVLPEEVTVTTVDVFEVTSVQAKAQGIINIEGKATIKSYGHCWSETIPDPTPATSNKTDLGSKEASTNFTSELTDLKANTTYYLRAYAFSQSGTYYGKVITFKTTNPGVPVVTTMDRPNIGTTTATITGQLVNSGATAVTKHGHVISQNNPAPTISDTMIDLGSINAAPKDFSSSFKNLKTKTTYYSRAFATNGSGTSYGKTISFTTLSADLAVVQTDSGKVGTNSITILGTIINTGGSPISAYGFCWSTTVTSPTIVNSKNDLGSTTQAIPFNSVIPSLVASTTYYVRAYATNDNGTSYGKIITLTTTSTEPATVETTEVGVPSTNSVTVNGNITNIGGAAVTQHGFCWSASLQNPTINNSKNELGGSTTAKQFLSILTGLEDKTIYYVRAYATNAGGTSYGKTLTFTTKSSDSPTVETLEAGTPTPNSVFMTGKINNIGGSAVVQHGFCWSSSLENPTIANAKKELGGSTTPKDFNALIVDLTPNTVYYLRAFATNNAGTSYGKTITIKTSQSESLTVETTGISNITQSSMEVSGSITKIGGTPVAQHGFCWSSSETEPTIVGTRSELGATASPKTFSTNIVNLKSGTTYYVRAYATNSTGTIYGKTIIEETTEIEKPTVELTDVGTITSNSIAVFGNIVKIGEASVSQHGFCWSTTETNPTIADTRNELGATGSPKQFSNTLINLTPNTTYYINAYATNSGGTSYSKTVTVKTEGVALPIVETTNLGVVTTNSIVATGSITSVGSSDVTQHGFCWSATEVDPTIAGLRNELGATGVPKTFSNTIINLKASTTYYIRAYATNKNGTSYGKTFTEETTGIDKPTVELTDVGSVTQNSIAVFGKILEIGGASVSQHGFCWSSTVTNPTIANTRNELGATGSPKNFSNTLTNLTPNTTYYINAYATNSGGTSYSKTISIKTDGVDPPVVETQDYGSITTSSVRFYASILKLGSGPLSQHGFCWSSTNPTPTIANDHDQLGGADMTRNFDSNISNLQPNTIYYVRAYGTNNGGTGYGKVIKIQTLDETLDLKGTFWYGFFTNKISGTTIAQEAQAHGIQFNDDGTFSFYYINGISEKIGTYKVKQNLINLISDPFNIKTTIKIENDEGVEIINNGGINIGALRKYDNNLISLENTSWDLSYGPSGSIIKFNLKLLPNNKFSYIRSDIRFTFTGDYYLINNLLYFKTPNSTAPKLMVFIDDNGGETIMFGALTDGKNFGTIRGVKQ